MLFSTIQRKIAVFSAIAVLATTVAIVGYGMLSARSTRDYVATQVGSLLDSTTQDGLATLASTQAGLIRSELDSAFDAARDMARAFEVLAGSVEQGGAPPAQRRAQFSAILLNVLKGNPRFNGTYSAWEPGALDGRDGEFKGRQDAGSDGTGRFLPYWTRDAAGRIAIQPLVEYDSRELHPNGVMKGGWYIGPMEGNGESILGPLPYVVQGKHVYLATMSVPVMVDGRFRGVAGADFDLSFVQKLAEQVSGRIYGGKASVSIITEKGLVVASSSHPQMIGQSFQAFDRAWQHDLDLIRAGRQEVSVDEAGDTIKVLSPITLGRTKTPWSVLITLPRSVAMAQATALEATLSARGSSDALLQLAVSLAIAVAAVAGMWFVARGVARPIQASARFAEGIAAGRFDEELTVTQNDETRTLAVALRKTASDLKQAEQDRAAAQARTEAERKAALAAMADSLEASVRGVVEALAGATGRMSEAAGTMSAVANQTHGQAAQVSSASTQASASVQTIATATEELSASVQEISRQVGKSTRIATEAVQSAEQANTHVLGLTSAAQEIGAIVQLISSIAGQTNLLALNATIEAARAGEAGRGFAVVASEVKTLAGETAKATTEIAAKVAEIQRVAAETAAGIRGIGEVIAETKEITTSIASAIEEQSATTGEIARSIQQTAAATQDVSRVIGGVSEVAADSRQTAGHVQDLSDQIANETGRLRQAVDGFLARVRAA